MDEMAAIYLLWARMLYFKWIVADMQSEPQLCFRFI